MSSGETRGISEIRAELDELDTRIIELLKHRFDLTGELAFQKQAGGEAAHQPGVQNARRAKWERDALECGLEPEVATDCYDTLHRHSVAQQQGLMGAPDIGHVALPTQLTARL
ncbi:MAG TPA: chorismate mutase [Candidatus Saccharimonadales bacterium]|nr:chorismate mutase [Candidatus Saccharimonadales bacterium]